MDEKDERGSAAKPQKKQAGGFGPAAAAVAIEHEELGVFFNVQRKRRNVSVECFDFITLVAIKFVKKKIITKRCVAASGQLKFSVP